MTFATRLSVLALMLCVTQAQQDCHAEPGYYCPETSSSAKPCKAGHFCLGGSAPQSACSVPRGYHCPRKGSDQEGVPCPFGYFCEGGTSRPKEGLDCEPGFSWNRVEMACTECGIGEFKGQEGKEACESCTRKPDHAVWTTSSGMTKDDCPWRCVAGFYRLGDACEIEIDCPVGLVYDESRRECVEIACPAGSSFDGIALQCQPCAIGTFKSNDGPGSCSSCTGKPADGIWAPIQGFSRDACPWCPPDRPVFERQGDICRVSCSEGLVYRSSQDACGPPCQAGEIYDEGSHFCRQDCESRGERYDEEYDQCYLCAEGEFYDDAYGLCREPCAPGETFQDVPTLGCRAPCTEGQIYDEVVGYCREPCPPGTRFDDGREGCFPGRRALEPLSRSPLPGSHGARNLSEDDASRIMIGLFGAGAGGIAGVVGAVLFMRKRVRRQLVIEPSGHHAA